MQNMPFYKPKGRLLFFNTEYTLHYTVCICRLDLRFLRSDTRVRDKKRLEKVGNLVKNSYLYR